MNHTKVKARYPSTTLEPLALIQPWNKGLGQMEGPLTADDVPALGWNLLHEDLSLPTAVLYEDKLAHNLKWMQSFAAAYGARLCPHGKTTMAPKLFHRQIGAGAWGITLATAQQARVAQEHGIARVLMANQLVGKQNMATISRLLEHPDFEFFCLVDSADNVEHLGEFFSSRRQRLNVLIELGAEDGRTGVRERDQLRTLLQALARHPAAFAVCGIEVYEGVLSDERAIRSYLHGAVDIARELAQQGIFHRHPVILTGAGSAWYDIVAEIFNSSDIGQPTEIILRPGCYITHDVGAYRTAQEQIQTRNPVAKEMDPALETALELWAYVQSVPEPEKAILAVGKRDAAFDAGLPVPRLHYRPGQEQPQAAPAAWTLTRIMDQHAFMHIHSGDNIRVGDMIAFDISHPCLVFDKWRCLPVLDSEYRVIDVVQTFF